MSISPGLIALVALGYMAILFAIAFYGDRLGTNVSPRMRSTVYSLSLAVYCSSWTFFGSVGQAAEQIWSFLPIYIGPILLLTFAPWVLKKMVIISKQENITSIADFIAARYGKSQRLAVVVTLIAMVGVLPYIALQLKGIVLGVNLLTGTSANSTGMHAQDTALIVTVALALFTILFGTRKLDVTEHHRGLMFAIAFESLVKLMAFVAVGLFVIYGLYNGFGDLWQQAKQAPKLDEYWNEATNWPAMIVQTCVAMMAIYTLPRQFHVTVVENNDYADLRVARWVFPAYLLIVALFIIPIALAGQLRLPISVVPDSFVISLPLAEGYPNLAILAFIGGASAATGMVIVAALTLAIMISNHILLPSMLAARTTDRPFEAFRYWMLTARRLSIIIILLLSYTSYRLLGANTSLATIGQIAFAALTQLAPAMLGALVWKQANRQGVFAGLIAGSLLWAYTLVLPLIASSFDWSLASFPGLLWLSNQPFGLPLDPLTLGVSLSLSGNFILFVVVSLFSKTRVSEHWQASRFIGQHVSSRQTFAVQVNDLMTLAGRFVGEDRARQSFIRFAYKTGVGFNPSETASSEWVAHTERLLNGVLGASSTRVVVKAAIEGRQMYVEDVVRIVGEASEVLQFNRTLLQGAIENITQGISVVDRSLRLVAWNSRYLKLFDYPEDLIQVGRPVADIIRHNAKKGLCGPGNVETHVNKRLYWMRQGNAHTSERLFPNGRVIELIGNPMPGGGFVMSFTDITEFREAEKALKEANESLEQRVSERTYELEQLNIALSEAMHVAENANQSKTRFLAAVSHDLMQPLNAARLFSAALSHQDALPEDALELVRNLDSSLRSAEDLISDLLDISRLESGRITPNCRPFALGPWLEALGAEFTALAEQQGIVFRLKSTSLNIISDPKLLRRIVQNFLTNAFRYANGTVLLGVRRQGENVRIDVWDRGQGIPEDKLKFIFEEFKRLDSHQTREEKGLGLGLAIADGLSKVLGHKIQVRSWQEKGSVFSITVPIYRGQLNRPTVTTVQNTTTTQPLAGIRVLCVDNESSILAGMHSLLSRWGCDVLIASNREQCSELIANGPAPDIALVDYHLDHGDTGIELMVWLRRHIGTAIPGIVISADARPELISKVHTAGLSFLAKPVKPAALRALINRHIPN
ncbi:MAG TPA: PAS domain-containing hybrid sensor histidine kinase/response regulator [Thiopseudomonas sp.]|nr:PAS domain-containing hybrid sensor histidine kinase/response regulator [Thiopseudomonas sp.]